ncbi:uncharacterized protein MYCFIDRAFT_203037 [Pseudocercospora fijiensis CIRAD86]|uniref:RRM domain-containing protein n=1 Tax=Pseudocercospora fijiensis (strain CIRAD86) TaxID=383855 RepID=M2Z3S8_PSEFD|nr:uncharacterized protein MYCFIDRAFT_203037 [Pseudocercospora fijiensis CIRAD86]EME84470.1 hypothetical protein MYCFIDRAFT_203037 [Pseudocercospora fijiensis CIRAD86]
MDRSLDEIIGERPERSRGGGGRGRGGRGGGGDRRPALAARAPWREEYPRDGVRKYRRDEPANIDSDWVHDRFEDDRYDRRSRAPADDRYGGRDPESTGSKLRVDNIHYELTEDDLRELFERVGPTLSVRLLYDRQDRSQGTAYVIYEDERDARDALHKFDGQNANGQPIRISLMPSGPSRDAPPRGIADRIERQPRSIFDRITSSRDDSRDGGRRPRQRSDSPRKSDRLAAPDVDRYVPGRGSRSPIRRRGTPRGGGRRPGERREDRGGRGPREPRERKPRVDGEGRPLVGGRPRKTAEELDAEMNDYWGGSKDDTPAGNSSAATEANGAWNGRATDDIDMDI